MDHKKAAEKSTIALFVSYYRPHLRLFFLDMICAAGVCAVDLLFPLITKYSLSTLLPEGLFSVFFGLMALMVGLYLVRGAMQYIIAYWGHTLGVRIEADIRRDLFAQLQKMSFSFFDRNQTGQLMSRVTGDLFEITELAHHGPEDLFISCVTILGAFAVMVTIQWKLALMILAVIPILVFFTVFLRTRMIRASKVVQERLAVINGDLQIALTGMRTAKAFCNEKKEYERFSESNDRFKTAKVERYRAMGLYTSSMDFFLSIMSVITIGFGGWLLLRDQLDYVELITFQLYIATFISPVRKLASFVEQYLVGMAGFSRFVELMRIAPGITDREDASELTDIRGEIEFRDVSFRYGESDTSGPAVLEHISIKLSPGETLAVVGPSGGGKTTMCSLIPRFYDVTDGAVLVDGSDVRSVTQESLRNGIGIVQQDVFLFAGTVLDNIRYGRLDASMEEVVEAARKAEILDDILAMPAGFETWVGERGVMLSGGQKQRISIARIFLKDPAVLILDEATSALDSVTEARIQNAFLALSKGRTTIIIAHRLSTVRHADRIAVVENGKISEEGSHSQLMAAHGAYEALYRAQNPE